MDCPWTKFWDWIFLPKGHRPLLPSPRLLVAARILAGLTQEALAAAAGISSSALMRIERGGTRPHVRTLHKLQDALMVEGVQFVFDSEGNFEGIKHKCPPQETSSSTPRPRVRQGR